MMLILLILLSSLLLGSFFIAKYIKTKDKKFLIGGLILSFILVGLIIYAIVYIPSTKVTYGPPEDM